MLKPDPERVGEAQEATDLNRGEVLHVPVGTSYKGYPRAERDSSGFEAGELAAD